MGVAPIAGWFIEKILLKMADLVVPPFMEPPMCMSLDFLGSLKCLKPSSLIM